MTDERQAFWAKCGACEHCWPICYLPMEAGKAGKLMKRLSVCPNCGENKKVFIAKQDRGVLLESRATKQETT